jgi:hypothetical protein
MYCILFKDLGTINRIYHVFYFLNFFAASGGV